MARPGESFDGDDFLLPDLGEGLEEAEVVEWMVEEGQLVSEGDTLALIETGKAQTEVICPRDGKVTKLYGKPGDLLKVGGPFLSLPPADAADPAAESTQPESDAAAEAGGSAEADTETQVEEDQEQEREDAGTVVGTLGATAGIGEEGKPLAAPAVRALARDLNVELSDIAGSGIGGRIIAGDVKAKAGKAGPPSNGRHTARPSIDPTEAREAVEPVPPSPEAHRRTEPKREPAPQRKPGEDVTRIPFRGLRRTIAGRLRESVDRAVHFTVMDEADVTKLEATRRRLIAATGQKVSLLPFACVAVARVLSGEFGYELQRLNSTTDDDNSEIHQHNRVHLGLAVDTSSGLMVPVIRDANTLGVMQLGERIGEVAAGSRDRSLPQSELQGSTFTVSNFGSYAGRFATPVINYPECGILAVGRMREGVVVKDGMMGVGKLLPLSLTCDHRVVDGGTATNALNQIIQLLQDPDRLLPQ